jgi:hypothetical protein
MRLSWHDFLANPVVGLLASDESVMSKGWLYVQGDTLTQPVLLSYRMRRHSAQGRYRDGGLSPVASHCKAQPNPQRPKRFVIIPFRPALLLDCSVQRVHVLHDSLGVITLVAQVPCRGYSKRKKEERNAFSRLSIQSLAIAASPHRPTKQATTPLSTTLPFLIWLSTGA